MDEYKRSESFSAGEYTYTGQHGKSSRTHPDGQERPLTIRKESWYQSRILKYLADTYPKAFVWKAAAGPYSRGGIPDVCAIIGGTFYGFEVKRPGGRPTDLQTMTIRAINEAGGVASIVTTVEDVERLIKNRRQTT